MLWPSVGGLGEAEVRTCTGQWGQVESVAEKGCVPPRHVWGGLRGGPCGPRDRSNHMGPAERDAPSPNAGGGGGHVLSLRLPQQRSVLTSWEPVCCLRASKMTLECQSDLPLRGPEGTAPGSRAQTTDPHCDLTARIPSLCAANINYSLSCADLCKRGVSLVYFYPIPDTSHLAFPRSLSQHPGTSRNPH